jgi:hypothetical protein
MKRVVLRCSLVASLITALLAGLFSASSGATATKVPIYPLRHAPHCRPGYTEVLREGRRDCLLTSGKTRKLGAFSVEKGVVRLDPSFTQAATDPLDTVWSYSVVPGLGKALPHGVLSFRLQNSSGQSYECAVNAGGGVTGSTCEIELPDVGKYTTIVEFESGTVSSVETERATVNPFPAHAKFVESTNAANEPVLTVTVSNQAGGLLPATVSNGGKYQVDLTASVDGNQWGYPLVYQSGTCVFYPQSSGSQTQVMALCNGETSPQPDVLATIPSTTYPSFPVTVQITLDQGDLNIGEDWTGYTLANPVQATLSCSASSCSWTS